MSQAASNPPCAAAIADPQRVRRSPRLGSVAKRAMASVTQGLRSAPCGIMDFSSGSWPERCTKSSKAWGWRAPSSPRAGSA